MMTRRTKPVTEPSAEPLMGLVNQLKDFWKFLRQVTGDDAYERYCAHYVSTHGASSQGANVHPQGSHCSATLLSRQQFFKLQQDDKWSGVSRCC